jgi:putative transcriptional regulator
MIRHYPAETTLIGYASGVLLPLHAQVVDLHLAQCPACRASVAFGEELGGALFDSLVPADMDGGALDRVLQRLDMPAPPESFAGPITPATIERSIEQGRWRFLGRGIKLLPLVPRDATKTRLDLIRVAPGTALPQHAHTGPETTYVLRGAFADETGTYAAGDIAEGDVGLEHQPRALADEECICLIATTGYLRARSLIVRLLQPAFGI